MNPKRYFLLRTAAFEDTTGVVPDGVRCGMPRCTMVLGDLVHISGVHYASLIEGFRREADGVYRLHRYAQKRYELGYPVRDSAGRWTGGIPTGKNTYEWGPGGGDIHDGEMDFNVIPRERIRLRERVELDKIVVKCPMCEWISSGRGT